MFNHFSVKTKTGRNIFSLLDRKFQTFTLEPLKLYVATVKKK